MASQHARIEKLSFSGSWAQSWSDSHSNMDQVRHVYVCAPVWYIVGSCQYAILGGSGVFQMYISYWDGSAWSAETHIEASGINGDITRRYGHNRDEGNLDGSFHNAYPLWRIRYWPSRSNSRWSITLYAGGWGVCNVVNAYPQGQKVRSRGRFGTAGSDAAAIHSAGTDSDEAYVRNNIFNWLSRKGASILAANSDAELVYYPYLT